MTRVPSFDELPRPGQDGLPLAAGVWGPDDQIGMLNNITPEKAAASAGLVRLGHRIDLDLPVHLPFGGVPPLHPRRRGPRQTLFKGIFAGLLHRDDKIDDLFLQGSSQWDGLSHIGDPNFGFYNNITDAQVTQQEGTRNGIEHVAAFGIFTRGVLLDMARHFHKTGRVWDHLGSQVISVANLEACMVAQSVRLEPGDVLLVHTGWTAEFDAGDAERRTALLKGPDYSGLDGGLQMWRFLWDHRVSALAADNVPVEVFPVMAGQASLHWAIPRLGLTLGELFALGELANFCEAQKRYDFLFVSKPLKVRGGVGSPPNAMAVF